MKDNEKKETVELIDEELEQVNGGYTISRVSIKAGECYEDVAKIFKVVNNANDVKVSDFVECIVYKKNLEETYTDNIIVSKLIYNCTYIGNNII